MEPNFVLIPEAVAMAEAGSRDDILELLSKVFADAWDLDPVLVQERLAEREKLGSTGFGRGVAMPHARMPDIRRPIAALVKLKRPVDFASADGLPVDLVFGLLSPENCGAVHLHALAAISRLMRDERVHEALADAPDAEAMFSLVTNATDRDAA